MVLELEASFEDESNRFAYKESPVLGFAGGFAAMSGPESVRRVKREVLGKLKSSVWKMNSPRPKREILRPRTVTYFSRTR